MRGNARYKEDMHYKIVKCTLKQHQRYGFPRLVYWFKNVLKGQGQSTVMILVSYSKVPMNENELRFRFTHFFNVHKIVFSALL